MSSEWISVKDRLPGCAAEDVRIRVANGEEALGWYGSNARRWWKTGDIKDVWLLEVTHWQPMPAPPTEGGQTE